MKVEIVALSGNGVATTNENDLSVVATVRFGNFDAVIGGDLSGFKTGSYEDIETSVAPKVGQVEVYKVNHHGSSYSSNDAWLATIKPKTLQVCKKHHRRQPAKRQYATSRQDSAQRLPEVVSGEDFLLPGNPSLLFWSNAMAAWKFGY